MTRATPSALLPLVLLAAAVLGARADAQTLVYPGHPDLAAVPVEDEIRVTRLGGHEASTVLRTVHRADGVVSLETVSEAYDGTSSRRTVEFAWPSLRPVATRAESVGEWTSEAAFDSARVVGSVSPADRPERAFDLTLERLPFQEEVAELVARALPLREGYVAEAITFSARNRTRDYTWTVVGPEDVALRDGTTVSAWAVQESHDGRYALPRTLYVDPETRALVAIRTPLGAEAEVLQVPTTRAERDAAAARRETAVSLRPGSPLLAVDALWSEARTYALRVVAPESFQQSLATVDHAWAVDAEAGQATLTVRSTSKQGRTFTETTTLAYPSLRPLSRSRDGDGEVSRWSYGDGTVRVVAGPDTTERAFEALVFGASAWLLYEVARLLPLTEGLEVLYRTDSAEGVREIALRVEGPAQIGGREVWVVAVDPGSDGNLVEVAFDPETRALVRAVQWPRLGMVSHLVPAD